MPFLGSIKSHHLRKREVVYKRRTEDAHDVTQLFVLTRNSHKTLAPNMSDKDQHLGGEPKPSASYILPHWVREVVVNKLVARLHKRSKIKINLLELEEAIYKKSLELGRRYDSRMLQLDKSLKLEGWTCSFRAPAFVFELEQTPSTQPPPPVTPRVARSSVGFEPDNMSLFD